jgi:hypothetical protein
MDNAGLEFGGPWGKIDIAGPFSTFFQDIFCINKQDIQKMLKRFNFRTYIQIQYTYQISNLRTLSQSLIKLEEIEIFY